jgi:hypothetical protein
MITNEVEIEPVVGMGVTYSIGSDRYPFSIIKVINHRTLIIQKDSFTRKDTNGLSEIQEYEYTPNVNSEQITITKRKDGCWRQKKSSSSYGIYTVGTRRAYMDPCF